MSDESTQKTRTTVSRTIFEQVKQMWRIKTKEELMDITPLGRTAINVLISKIEKNENLSFEDLYFKAGQKKKCKEAPHAETRSTLRNDNSLTLRGCKDKILVSLSIPQLSREIKSAGMARKRIKKKIECCINSCKYFFKTNLLSERIGKISKTILFLDESGFNLQRQSTMDIQW
ncbi:hypothetical protein CDIK_2629 [Cucumispora dikerogammari]|nr:hypothetical protein CDIK_2629 [Cucumispora dikerogammari]